MRLTLVILAFTALSCAIPKHNSDNDGPSLNQVADAIRNLNDKINSNSKETIFLINTIDDMNEELNTNRKEIAFLKRELGDLKRRKRYRRQQNRGAARPAGYGPGDEMMATRKMDPNYAGDEGNFDSIMAPGSDDGVPPSDDTLLSSMLASHETGTVDSTVDASDLAAYRRRRRRI